MLTTQGGRFEQALIDGGVGPLAASNAMNAVANCAQPLVHRGPVSFDYTSPKVRFVTPTLRKYQFPNLDKVNPDRRPPTSAPPDEKKRKRPEEEPPQEEPVQFRDKFEPELNDSRTFNITSVVAGPYITTQAVGRGVVRVSANVSGNANQVAVIGNNTLRGQTLDIKSKNPDVIKVIKTGGSLTWTIVPVGERTEVVTNVDVGDRSITITRRPCFLFDPGPEEEEVVDLKKVDFLKGVTDTGSSLDFEVRSGYFLVKDEGYVETVSISTVDCTV
jgi:hypothetical protein